MDNLNEAIIMALHELEKVRQIEAEARNYFNKTGTQEAQDAYYQARKERRLAVKRLRMLGFVNVTDSGVITSSPNEKSNKSYTGILVPETYEN